MSYLLYNAGTDASGCLPGIIHRFRVQTENKLWHRAPDSSFRVISGRLPEGPCST